MKITIPNVEELELNTIILDLNGTLAVNGQLVEGVEEKIKVLKEKHLRIVLFSADTRGNAAALANNLGIELIGTANAEEKVKETQKLDSTTCVSIGNGLIDEPMMKIVKLAIVTLQSEGVHIKTLLASDIVVPSINDALDLLIDENKLKATLRK